MEWSGVEWRGEERRGEERRGTCRRDGEEGKGRIEGRGEEREGGEDQVGMKGRKSLVQHKQTTCTCKKNSQSTCIVGCCSLLFSDFTSIPS